MCLHAAGCKHLTEQHCHLCSQWCHLVLAADQPFSRSTSVPSRSSCTLGNSWGGNIHVRKEEMGIYHYSFCSRRRCPFIQWGTNPSVHFSGGCGIQQDELGWTGCHLVLPPTHPKGQLSFPAGSPGLLPLASGSRYSAVAAGRPMETAAMVPCSGMKDFFSIWSLHTWWASCWCFLLLITTLTFPVGFPSFSDICASFWSGFVV